MDAFAIAIILFVISAGIGAVNIIVTALSMRAKGMTWNRTPIFVLGITAGSLLGLVALPCFEVAMLYTLLDRSMLASFFTPDQGGSQWLYANLFWLMGHPEVYVILIPGTAAVLEMTPVFARKPLYGAKMAVVGISRAFATWLVVIDPATLSPQRTSTGISSAGSGTRTSRRWDSSGTRCPRSQSCRSCRSR